MQYNVWIKLAKIVNTTDFCLTDAPDMHGLLSTCLIPICKAPGSLGNVTGLSKFLNFSEIHYHTMAQCGIATYQLPQDAIQLYTPYVVNHKNNTCARMVNCSIHRPLKGCLSPRPSLWNCSKIENVTSNYGHIILPIGWFFTCGSCTYNYVPANITLAQCCLSRLTVFLPPRPTKSTRQKRETETMNAVCDGNVTVLSPAEYISLAMSLVGVPGLAVGNAKQLGHLACLLAKTINSTSIAIGLLIQEQQDLRHAILDNRAAIDFLLLQRHLGCEAVENMCCFNLTDNSNQIQHQLDLLKKYAHAVKQDIAPEWWKFLWSWFPTGWFKTIFQYAVLIVFLLITFCCFIQCIPGLLSWCFPLSANIISLAV
ncbi:syncytin-A-like [Elgaria multicarinata webbii]|uniref:syncytin-A-like n=1 Tax=Elgaria multicarinata webbii TaxID=159646 RepID=UPI002FCCBCE2